MLHDQGISRQRPGRQRRGKAGVAVAVATLLSVASLAGCRTDQDQNASSGAGASATAELEPVDDTPRFRNGAVEEWTLTAQDAPYIGVPDAGDNYSPIFKEVGRTGFLRGAHYDDFSVNLDDGTVIADSSDVLACNYTESACAVDETGQIKYCPSCDPDWIIAHDLSDGSATEIKVEGLDASRCWVDSIATADDSLFAHATCVQNAGPGDPVFRTDTSGNVQWEATVPASGGSQNAPRIDVVDDIVLVSDGYGQSDLFNAQDGARLLSAPSAVTLLGGNSVGVSRWATDVGSWSFDPSLNVQTGLTYGIALDTADGPRAALVRGEGDQDRDGIIDDPQTLTLWDPVSETELWSVDLQNGFLDNSWNSEPILLVGEGDDQRIVWSEIRDFYTADQQVHTVKLDGTDEQAWSTQALLIQDSIGSCLVAAGDVVVNAPDNCFNYYEFDPGRTGTATAYWPENGDELWTLQVTGAVMQSSSPDILLTVDTASYGYEGQGQFNEMTVYGPATPNEPTASVLVGGVPGGETAPLVKPAAIPDCPGSTELLAWAELTNGWVLVCGISESEPTYWAASVGGAPVVTSDHVAYVPLSSDGLPVTAGGDVSSWRYLAMLPNGDEMRLDYSPATFGQTDAAGNTVLQESVLLIFFVNLSSGANQQNQGAYGLRAPDDTAEDQVRYLAELLATSYEGRAALGEALGSILDCSKGATRDADIRTLESVRDNREYLLTALAGAPVDKVPQGVKLVDELTASLEASYNADVAFVSWAKSTKGSCPDSGSSEGARWSKEAQVHKRTFCELWNKVIYPKFNVQEVSPEYL